MDKERNGKDQRDRFREALILHASPWGYAHHRILLDEAGCPVDYEFLDINSGFEELTGLRRENVLHRRATEVLPGIDGDDFDWIRFYGTLALQGGSRVFERYSEPLGRWFQVQAFSSEKEHFTTLFVDITAEKQRTEELESFFEVNPDLLCIGDTQGNFIKVNRAWEETLGYDARFLEGQRFLQFVHPEDREATLEAMAKLEAQEQVLQFVNRYRRKDGTYRFIEWRSYPRGRRIYAAARDVTEQRRILEELKAQQEQFQLAIRGSNDGIWDWNIETDELFLSEHWKKMLGYRDEELPNEFDTFASLLYEEDRERVFEYVREYLRGEREKYALEFRMVHKDGSLRWILAKGEALRNERGIPYRMAGSHSDVTERKEMEFQLLRERERLASRERKLALQSAMQEILMHTAKHYINTSPEEMEHTVEQSLGEISRFVGAHRAYVFDYDWEAQTCSNTYEWCHEGISPQKEALQGVSLGVLPWWVEAHRRGETLYIPEVTALPEDDRVRIILESQEIRSLMTVPMMEAGTCVGFVGFDSVREPHTYTEREKALLEIFAEIMVNLRTRRALENRLVEEKEKAQAASRAKSEFLANMSHEIRTPLNGVIGFTELLQHTPLSPVQKQYVQNANTSGHALLGIINDILDFSKIEAGKLDLEMVETDLSELAEQSIGIIEYGAVQKGLEVLLDLDPAMPRYALVDPVRLKQVLANLLSNAVKFTERGEVALQVRHVPGETPRGRFTFSVRDTGIGIGPEDQKKLFKVFSQGDSSTTRKFGGTGLGLVISQKLVQKMGGTLTLESAPRKGSLFSFSIETECRKALESPAQDSGGENPEAFPERESPLTILVAEDNPVNMLLVTTLLRKVLPSVRLVEAKNGREAVRIALEEENPAMMFMDVQMPQMDGNEATRSIRSREKETGRHLPIIGLSAGALSTEREKSLQAGMDDFLTKPIALERLQRVLAAHLSETKPFPSSSSASFPCRFDAAFLEEDLGDPDTLQYLMETTLETFPRMLREFREAFREGDFSGAVQAIHSLKGAASSMRFCILEKMAEELERDLRRGNLQDLEKSGEKLEEEWRFLVPLLEERRHKGLL